MHIDHSRQHRPPRQPNDLNALTPRRGLFDGKDGPFVRNNDSLVRLKAPAGIDKLRQIDNWHLPIFSPQPTAGLPG
jgi:hypothetical protein